MENNPEIKVVDEKPVQLTPEPPKLPEGFTFTGIFKGDIPVIRDSRVKLKADKQLKLYALCPCGSGKKNKWCCAGKEMVVINTG
jgi:hypothetical protein